MCRLPRRLAAVKILKPGYDSGAVVYDSIFSLLSRGKEQLLQSSAMVPGDDDLCCGAT